MTVILEQAAPVPKTIEFINAKRTVRASRRNVSASFSGCKSFLFCFDCKLPVFADLTTSNENVNDFSSFIYNVGDTETIIATITNIDTGVVNVISDNSFGIFYDTDFLKEGVWGFKLDWRAVALALGFGNYTFNVVIDNPQERGDFNETFCYSLKKFSCKGANGTTRMTISKDGYIENGFDYRDLVIGPWIDQIRLYGKFTLTEHITTVDNYIVNPRDKEQIQTQIVDNFNLTLSKLRNSQIGDIIKDNLLGNKIEIDDYNMSNVGDFVKKSVALLSIETPIAHEINGTWTYQIKFEERNQSTLKRNH